ncbi:hypothetical protein JCM5296_002761 [Sporobolomyces johnsonii]
MVNAMFAPRPPAPPPAPTAPASAPLSVTRSFRPYYSPLELNQLVHLQSAARSASSAASKQLSDQAIDSWRQLAAGYIERVANRLGFPRRTIATAQTLYHRFHLHFPLRDFAYQDVSLSALLVASKLQDTLKKLREIQIAAWQVTNILEGGTGQGEGDQAAQEQHRPHLIGIERLILQTICFNFNLHRSLAPSSSELDTATLYAVATPAPSPTSRDIFTHLVRLSHLLPPSQPAVKTFTYLAFLLATDLHRTLLPLSYPPHTCAAACLWLAGFLFVPEGGGALPPIDQGWADECESTEEDLDDIAHGILDLLIALCPSPASALPATTTPSQTSPSFSPASFPSPSEPSLPLSTPSASSSAAAANPRQTERDKQLLASGIPNAFSHPHLVGRTVDGLTEVKIRLRSRRRDSSLPLRRGGGGGGGGGGELGGGDLRSAIKRRAGADPPPPPPPPPPSSAPGDEPDPTARAAKRWKHVSLGLSEIARMRDEAEEKDRVKAEEREEREREKMGLAGAGGGGVGAMTEEERERRRSERRERGRPGSVRYRF